MQLDRAGFSSYKIEKNTTIGLSIQNLSKVMRLVNQNDSITLKIADSGEDSGPTSIQIICESNRTDGRTTEFSLNLLSLDSESLGIPETVY